MAENQIKNEELLCVNVRPNERRLEENEKWRKQIEITVVSPAQSWRNVGNSEIRAWAADIPNGRKEKVKENV